MDTKELYKVESVCVKLNVSVQTINNWYRFKRLHPDNVYAQILPNFTQSGSRQTRYWTESDITKLQIFKDSIPHGRGGVLGEVTNRGKRRHK